MLISARGSPNQHRHLIQVDDDALLWHRRTFLKIEISVKNVNCNLISKLIKMTALMSSSNWNVLKVMLTALKMWIGMLSVFSYQISAISNNSKMQICFRIFILCLSCFLACCCTKIGAIFLWKTELRVNAKQCFQQSIGKVASNRQKS